MYGIIQANELHQSDGSYYDLFIFIIILYFIHYVDKSKNANTIQFKIVKHIIFGT